MIQAAAYLSVFLVLAVSLLPHQIVTYKSCCYDENGILALNQCGCSKESKPTLRERRECCEPTIHKLKSENPSHNAVSTVIQRAPIDVRVPEPLKIITVCAQPIIFALALETGPPTVNSLFVLQTRFNL